MRTKLPILRFASGLLLALGLAWACSSTQFGGMLHPEASVVWPRGAHDPRVEVLFCYEGTSKPDGNRGFFSNINDWIIGDEEIRFMSPYGMALAEDGTLYVADAGLAAVHAINFEAQTHKLLNGKGANALRTPIGVAIGPRGRIYVTDSSTGRIHIFSADGTPAGTFGGPDETGRPTGVAYDSFNNRLLVTDTTGGRVLVYSMDGELQQAFGNRGEESNQFNFPTNLAVDSSGQIFVVDTMNFRVQAFTPEFELVNSFGVGGDGPGAFARPKGIALDSEGHVYVVDALFDNIQIFTGQGELLLPVGSKGSGFGGFFLPTGIMIDSRDRIFVADAGNARIQVLQYRSLAE